MQQYDVMVVGAGMVGLSIAAYLGQQGISVAVADPSLQHPIEATNAAMGTAVDDYDLRVSALSAESQTLLAQLGAWPLIERKQPYHHMHVWDGEGTGSVSFHCQDLHRPDLGHIVENRHTLAALRQVVEQLPVTLLPYAVAYIDNPQDDWTPVMLANDTLVSACLVVGADGAHSRVRQWAGLSTREWDYQHHAIVATLRMQQPLQNTAWQRFRPQGPLALLPLAGDEQLASIVWSTEVAEAQALMQLDAKDFAEQLALAFENRLGSVLEVSQRAAIPLRQRHAKHYVSAGVALAGDAAHTIHPLAGQGVNLGFKDARVLSEEVVRACQRGLHPGSLAILQRYQRRRQSDNLATMAAMEGFKRLFAAQNPWFRLARNQGMRWFDACLPVKQHIMQKAMGL
ncbi:2-octaprenyl-3-methyl-6-methoxy-1,4-benzoquinol hydroxylase [Bacterioplanes sanyensis]|uniref:2-octaprenyl-3-methyl-6-methoxy-1,4-benzoquinol hydroxylase n=1 Tax=Bacterioplanes sanyensis TaxID=1249553 RepID=A0A222FFH0_9GAMM|nr:UbiH/UbiF/VisC/COQ6 family ubiquinone biosynthesis hydroxylase [Bacterioplanes sanyensis]ASP37758.1 2-octaprenyl-3-methyl-6-methoxy-1,4-benzoquinol hydroxylase [Bacterioplanes sanyensis]